jgi:hypothetical protein
MSAQVACWTAQREAQFAQSLDVLAVGLARLGAARVEFEGGADWAADWATRNTRFDAPGKAERPARLLRPLVESGGTRRARQPVPRDTLR